MQNVVGFLNKTLKVACIMDASVNGLQVRSRSGAITKIGFAVDACLSTFEKAAKLDVDLLVVHHGIKWRPRKEGEVERMRAAFLKKQNMALYAAHLPLDLHEEYGNNIQLSRMLQLRDHRKFGRYHGIKIGYAGTLAAPAAPEALAAILNRRLRTTCRVFPFGKKRARTLGIISGGGGSMLAQAVRDGLDCFLVGEIDLAGCNAARDCGINVIVAGHYATETVGVKALMPVVGEVFGIETVFVDDPKGL